MCSSGMCSSSAGLVLEVQGCVLQGCVLQVQGWFLRCSDVFFRDVFFKCRTGS